MTVPDSKRSRGYPLWWVLLPLFVGFLLTWFLPAHASAAFSQSMYWGSTTALSRIYASTTLPAGNFPDNGGDWSASFWLFMGSRFEEMTVGRQTPFVFGGRLFQFANNTASVVTQWPYQGKQYEKDLSLTGLVQSQYDWRTLRGQWVHIATAAQNLGSRYQAAIWVNGSYIGSAGGTNPPLAFGTSSVSDLLLGDCIEGLMCSPLWGSSKYFLSDATLFDLRIWAGFPGTSTLVAAASQCGQVSTTTGQILAYNLAGDLTGVGSSPTLSNFGVVASSSVPWPCTASTVTGTTTATSTPDMLLHALGLVLLFVLSVGGVSYLVIRFS